jgi:hypothetical protein
MCATDVVYSSTLAPNLHIRTLCVLPFTRSQPGFNLCGELLVRDFGLSVQYSFELDGHVVCQKCDSQVCGRSGHFLRSSVNRAAKRG